MSLENLSLQDLQNLRQDILSNFDLSEEQIETLHAISKAELKKTAVSPEQVDFQRCLDRKIKEAKEQCSNRISSYDGKRRSINDWLLKSQNIQDIKSSYISILLAGQSPTSEQASNFILANKIIERKDRLVIKYQELMKAMIGCASIKDLDLIVVKDESHWAVD